MSLILELDDIYGRAPIILVQEGPGAAEAICEVLARFPFAVQLVERITIRPPNNPFEEVVYSCVSPDTFDIMAEVERMVGRTGQGEHASAFLLSNLNQVVSDGSQTFAIAIGGHAVEAELRELNFDIRPFVLPAPWNGAEWNADRLAEFIVRLLDPDEEGRDDDSAFHPTPEDLPPDDGSDAMSFREYIESRFGGG